MSASPTLPGPPHAAEKTTPIPIVAEAKSKPGPKPGAKLVPKPRKPADELQRFFLSDKTEDGLLRLGEEFPSEREALVRAFRDGKRLYVVTVFEAEIDETNENATVIVKRAVPVER